MGFLDMIFNNKTITKPTFIKDFNSNNTQLRDLEELLSQVTNPEKKDIIERDIMFLRQGISGENNVYFELKNSFLPMLCLHDVRIEYDGYVAQLDFVVITNKFMCIIETKKLNGNITINRDGDFIRTIKNKYGKEEKEGIYSPISQNKRHVNIVKKVLSEKLKINNMPVYSLVVIANPKSIINKDKCPNDIKYCIYKYDQVAKQLEKYKNNKKNEYDLDEKRMLKIANLLKEMDTPIRFKNRDKYGLTDTDFEQINITMQQPVKVEVQTSVSVSSSTGKQKSRDLLEEQLKKFRLEQSKKENIPAYYIFNNAEMEELISKYPLNIEDLKQVKGFNDKKIDKYSEDILKIFNI